MIHSFLLIGQSNMAGRGKIGEAVQVDSSRIKVLRNGRWQPMYRPVNPDRAFSGVSLAESFAEAYSKKYNVDVGLIPCADGGTSLEQWKPGSLLYDHAVYQARLADRTSTIAAVLWHQGEGDCDLPLYSIYQTRFEYMMTSLRRDLNLFDVPFLLGGLGDFLPECIYTDKLKNYIQVNATLEAVASNNAMTGFVPATGLTSNPDYLHFNSASLHEFGLCYFAEFERLRDPSRIFREKPCEDDALRSDLEKL